MSLSEPIDEDITISEPYGVSGHGPLTLRELRLTVEASDIGTHLALFRPNATAPYAYLEKGTGKIRLNR